MPVTSAATVASAEVGMVCAFVGAWRAMARAIDGDAVADGGVAGGMVMPGVVPRESQPAEVRRWAIRLAASVPARFV